MMIKEGVVILGMRPELMPALLVANEVFALNGLNMVITSVKDGQHSENSYHYKGLAFDCRTSHCKGRTQVHMIAQDIQKRLGFPFDVVVEKTHIHIEYDLRKQEAALRRT